MKTLTLLALTLGALTTWAADPNPFRALNVAAVSMYKDEFGVRSLTLRTRKALTTIQGHEARYWDECELKSEASYLGAIRTASVSHRGAWETPEFGLKLPADQLSASATARQRGFHTALEMDWYQGSLAHSTAASFAPVLEKAAQNMRGITAKQEFYFYNTSEDQNASNAVHALRAMGGVPGLKSMLKACGAEAGLQLEWVDLSLMKY